MVYGRWRRRRRCRKNYDTTGLKFSLGGPKQAKARAAPGLFVIVNT